MAIGGVEASLASSPKGLKNVLHRFFRVRIHQQRQVAPKCALHPRCLLSSVAEEIDDDVSGSRDERRDQKRRRLIVLTNI